MITANIKFLNNNLMAEMSCKESELRDNLQKIGVITTPSMITLDNTRTLQIVLTPNDEMGKLINRIVNIKSDTLGMVQRLCRNIYCMTDKNAEVFANMIDSGEIRSVDEGIKAAEKMREQWKEQHSR